jgi:hypothetical protein
MESISCAANFHITSDQNNAVAPTNHQIDGAMERTQIKENGNADNR